MCPEIVAWIEWKLVQICAGDWDFRGSAGISKGFENALKMLLVGAPVVSLLVS